MTRRLSCRYLVFAFGILLAFATSPTGAESSQEAGWAGAVMMDEDYFSAGGSAELDKRVEGDAFLSGGRVAVRGPVKGDVAVAGGDVSAADTVGQDLYAAGGSVAISGQVAGNARIAGAQVTISPRGGIAGKASVAAANLRMAGRVGRYLAVYAESVRIEGEVGGDLRIMARLVEIGPEAKISGKLIYRSPQPAKIDPTAVIAGGVTHVPMEWPSGRLGSLARVATWISMVLLVFSLLLVGVIMIVAFPKFSSAAAHTVQSDPWKSLALGFCLMLCLPAAAIVFMITVIGIPLGVAVLLFYPVMLLLGLITGALFLGDLLALGIARRRGAAVKPGWRHAALSASLLALLLVCKIPLAGCSIALLVMLFGLGAFWICAYRVYLRRSPAQEPSPLGLDLV
jgi:cytoskeletal protein CcmA (bactofilin family)